MIRALSLLLSLLLADMAAAEPTRLVNQLADNPSPYLAMHRQDPVHWQQWSAETLALAQALDRPLLVSVGYFSCHWCHVMQRESYQDPQLAQLLNSAFIPVKVDRELEPALDAHLIAFVERTRGQAGWPLNVFLTPDGYPIVGALYLPRDRFHDLLKELDRRWQEDPVQLTTLARNGLKEWRLMRAAASKRRPASTSFSESFDLQSARMQDEMSGGFGEQSKFPMVSQLRALLWLRAQQGRTTHDEFIRLTLDRMAGQGLRDMLGGGFFRYVTDPNWQIPHYEKMLYDNARLALLYLEAAQQFQSAQYRAVGLDTLDFMIRQMRTAEGYFISSFSAVDAQGREGFFYLWDDATLKSLLDAQELKAVTLAWFANHAAEQEYGKLPRVQMSRVDVAARLNWKPEKLDAVLASARDKLLAARAKRSLPADDKGLAAWNGLALSALAAGDAASPGNQYAEAAAPLADYLATRLWDGQQLVRALDGDTRVAEASLEDYALVAQGLWDWSQRQAKPDYRATVEAMLRVAWQRYFADNRWLLSDRPLIPMLDGSIALEDSSLPSATALISQLSTRHESLKNDSQIQQQVDAHLGQVKAYLGNSAFWYAGYVALLGEAQSLR